MTAGALVLFVSGDISPSEAMTAVDWNVIAYLFGVFSISHALYDCGISHRLSALVCNSGISADRTLFLFMRLSALVSAVLTNDAAATIGTPIALSMAFQLGIRPAIPLIALCVAVTIGSMMSPVGNPQNILIVAAGQFGNPIAEFLRWLAMPTLMSLLFAYAWYRRCLAREACVEDCTLSLPEATSKRSWPSLTATGLLIVLVIADSVMQSRIPEIDVPLGLISVFASLPIYLFSSRRLAVLKEVDWHTLMFFVAMFIVTGAVLESGVLQNLLGSWQSHLGKPVPVLIAGFGASQLFSNVPVVQIYLNLLPSADTATLMLLAGISTLAGNLFIISAASNVIVVQQTEKLGSRPFHFWEFARYVLPVAIVSVALCYAWVVYLLPFF
jgi:Na+/H+ antiporter NhaD/arsenite permease-like protein